MAIRQIPKEPELPPAHLYLEDIRELVDAMNAAATKAEVSPTNAPMWFTVGERRCDTIADLQQLGGTSRDFAVHIEPFVFRVYRTGVICSDEIGDTVSKLMHTREMKIKSATKALVPFWVPLGWVAFSSAVLPALAGHAHSMLFLCVWVAVGAVLGSIFIWTELTDSVVELRYSYEKPPATKWMKENASKAIWFVLGSLFAGIGQLLWHWITQHFGK